MKGQYFVLAAVFGFLCCCCTEAEAEEHWVWPTSSQGRNRRDERAERFREPTTKRPAPGAPLNEEIDDYPEGDDKTTNVGTRQYPFGFNGGQLAGGGGIGGFNNYPGIGGGGYGGVGGNSLANGILVGPGGPTGIIGRPPNNQYFPTNGGRFPGAYGQTGAGGLGFPQHTQQPGGIGFGGGFGQNQGYPVAQQGGQYPGGYYNGGGIGGGGGIVGGQYPGQAGQYPLNNQFGGAQYPGTSNVGIQYPGVNGQYPGGGPIFTEGYGLLTNGGYHPGTQPGFGYPQSPFGCFNGFGGGNGGGFGNNFDEQSKTKRKLQIEEKSANIESSSNVERTTVDDKISRGSTKKST